MRSCFRLALYVLCWVILASCNPRFPSTPQPPSQTPPPLPVENKTAQPNPTQPARASQTPTQAESTPATQTAPPIIPSQTATESVSMPEAQIAQAQARLLVLGYNEVGRADGIFSGQTRAAVSHFQYLNRLAVSGELDQDTLAALDHPDAVPYRLPPPFPGLLVGPGVDLYGDQALHARLAELGYIADDEEEWFMNQYGPTTREAVRRFQELSGLEINGLVDLTTWRALFSPWANPADGSVEMAPPLPDAWETNIYPVGENPFVLAGDGQRIWVAHRMEGAYPDNFILAIDPGAGAADIPVPILVNEPGLPPQPIGGMAFAGDRLWLLFPNRENPGEGPFLRSISPEAGVLSDRLEFAECPDGFCFPSSAFGYDGSLLWASAGDRVVGIDPVISQPVQSHPVGWLASGEIILGNGCLWFSGEVGLTAFTPAGGECPFAELAYALPGDALAFDGKRIWGASTDGGFINWLDIETGEIGSPIEVSGGPSALVYDGSQLWVALEQIDSLAVIDVEKGETGKPIPVCQGPVDLEFSRSQLWVACPGSQAVQSLSDIHEFTDQDQLPPLASATPAIDSNPPPTATENHTPTPTLPLLQRNLFLTSPRMQGDDVLMLQQRLLDLGYTEVGELDGIFGPKTEQAVKHFQEVNGLLVDGVVGPQTWAALFSLGARSP